MNPDVKAARLKLKSAIVQLNEVKLVLTSLSHCAVDDVNKAIAKANLAMRRLSIKTGATNVEHD